MAVAFDSIVNIAPATGIGPVTTPAITMPGSNPVAILCVVLRHASATVSGTPTTTFGGVVSEIANVRTVNAGFEVLASIWRIVAPTANANGTASVTFTASVP